MKLTTYIKRAGKYVLYEHRPINVEVKVYQEPTNKSLEDKVALITGGGSGLGFYIAKRFLENGANVIISGRNKNKLEQAINKLGPKASYIQYDVQETEKAAHVIEEALHKFGKIDILVNNAGISLHEQDFTTVKSSDFEQQVDTNLKGGYFLSQAYINTLLKTKATGQIIFVSSERGSQCDVLPYGLTKVAINSLVRGLSNKYYKHGIRINGIAPGVTATDMTGIDRDKNMFKDSPAGRYFVPEEVVEVVAFLVSNHAKCISGEIIHCNAGDHIKGWWGN